MLTVVTVLRVSGVGSERAADAVVVGIVQALGGLEFAELPAAYVDDQDGLLTSLLVLRASAAVERLTRLIVPGTNQLLVAVGLGDKPASGSSYDPELLRRAAGTSVRALGGVETVVVALPVNDIAGVRAVGEGVLLASYALPTRYRKARRQGDDAPVAEATIVVPENIIEGAESVARRATAVAGGVALARDLVNSPPSVLGPEEFADLVRDDVDGLEVRVDVLDEQMLRDGGFGGIVGVGQGSERPPRLLHLSYRTQGATATRIALVGKGITFDSGGLCLKPATELAEMKMDMAGAAAVVAAVRVVAQLGMSAHLDAWVPLAENMPSGRALRPSDVLTMRNGLQVEVNDTDAEGRLILADAIARACEDEPHVVVDVATLTSAQMIALGTGIAAVMSNDDCFRAAVVDASTRAGEPAWGMPLPVELRKSLDSSVADLVNYGPREGAMLTAGLFLKEFVAAGVQWAHIDIAGPAYNRGPADGYMPRGGTGAAVRTLVQVIEDLSTEK